MASNVLRTEDNGRTILPSRQQDKSSSLIGMMKTDRTVYLTILVLLRKLRMVSFIPLRVTLATPVGSDNILSDIMKSSATVCLLIKKVQKKNRGAVPLFALLPYIDLLLLLQ